MTVDRPLWTCPACGKRFVNRNNWHSCVTIDWRDHFADRPEARRLFDHLLETIESFGPVSISTSKTRIAFMTRVRFAGCEVRKDWLRCGLWLKRQISSPRFVRVERYTPTDYGYTFELRAVGDLDDEIIGYLREAYDVGLQRAGGVETEERERS